MKKLSSILIALVCLLNLSACKTNDINSLLNTTNLGRLAGAGAGAWAGSNVGKGNGKTLATVGGALVGLWVGGEIAKYLSTDDQKQLAESTQKTAETGKLQSLYNPETKVSAQTQIVKSPTQNASNCKTVLQDINIDGNKKTEKVQACKVNGVWKVG